MSDEGGGGRTGSEELILRSQKNYRTNRNQLAHPGVVGAGDRGVR